MTNQELWQAVLGQLELNLSKASFTTWLKNTSIISQNAGEVVVGVPNGFTKEWLENKYHKFILKSVQDITGELKSVKYIISAAVSNSAPESQDVKNKIKTEHKNIDEQRPEKTRNYAAEPSCVFIESESNLNPRYTFESFIVGSHNELAHAACIAVTRNLGTNYNPLFIYGSVGLGKTHLLQAIGNKVISDDPNKKICYTTSEKFASELISSIRDKTVDKFKLQYAKFDVLIIDDIQFLSGKEKTQEEFFHIFNALYQKNKQIVLSSDRPPKAIPTLEERLRSRFEGGMIADVGAPDFETRMAILKAKVKEKNLNISPEVLDYIATNIQKNIRELEGALKRVQALSEFSAKTITLKEVEGVLADVVSSTYRKSTTTKEIIKIVSEFYNVEAEELSARSRKQEIVKPRQIAMYLMRSEINTSFSSIGEVLGKKDHTTVMHAVNKIQEDISLDKNIEQEIILIKQRIYNQQ
jgi:chromosomal replication initiator protein